MSGEGRGEGPGDCPILTALAAQAPALGDASHLRVAYSGGLDSSVLLHAVQARFPGRVSALHANHGLHGDAAAWEHHCRRTCDTMGVDLLSTELQVHSVGNGPEAAARAARMSWFAERLEPDELLLLAHHRDDQAETVLLRLLRGSGPAGLAAMPVERPLGAGRLLRPLLALPRSALAEYARRHGLRWVDDPSNMDDRFDRNYLRHRVMPVLRSRWTACDATLARAAELLREIVDEGPPAPPRIYSVIGDPGFAVDALTGSEATRATLLRTWLRDSGLLAPGRTKLVEFLRQLREGQGASLATRDWSLTRFRGAVYAHPGFRSTVSLDRPVIPGEALTVSGVGRIEVVAAATGSGGTMGPEPVAQLVLALRRGGERLASNSGQHRTLKAVLQELGVPPWWRDRLPLLFEERRGQRDLLAVGHLLRTPRCRSLGLGLYWIPDLLAVDGGLQRGAGGGFD